MAAGILLGGFMQPHLNDGDRPSGPQMFAGWAGTRSTGPFDPGTTFASYQGSPPDYVLGTDWKKTMAWPSEPAAVSTPPRERELARNDELPPDPAPTLTRADYEAPRTATPASGYPSLGGGQPASATATVDTTEDAAPVITG